MLNLIYQKPIKKASILTQKSREDPSTTLRTSNSLGFCGYNKTFWGAQRELNPYH
jgi:hypothetical protein